MKVITQASFLRLLFVIFYYYFRLARICYGFKSLLAFGKTKGIHFHILSTPALYYVLCVGTNIYEFYATWICDCSMLLKFYTTKERLNWSFYFMDLFWLIGKCGIANGSRFELNFVVNIFLYYVLLKDSFHLKE